MHSVDTLDVYKKLFSWAKFPAIFNKRLSKVYKAR